MTYWALIIEDSEALRQVFTDMLEHIGFEVMTAKDGTQAINILDGVVPDLITLDINIPGTPGLNVLQYIRESKVAHQATVVVISGDPPDDHAAEAELADVYLMKPVGMGELVKLGQRLMQSSDETQPVGHDIRRYLKDNTPSHLWKSA